MTTANEIVEDAAALILVDEANTALEANEAQILLRFLNDYCAELYDLGVDFGYRPVSSLGDVLTSPPSVNTALKANLALRSNPVFGLPVPPETLKLANDTEKRLKANFMRRPRRKLPRELPSGSGRWVWDSAFFPFPLPEGFLRVENTITVSISAADTPVQISGWVVDRTSNVTAKEDGTVEYLNQGPYLANLEANLTVDAQGSDLITFYFAKNGAIIENSRLPVDADTKQNVRVQWPERLRLNDVVTLLVENNSDDTDVVITAGHFRVQ